MRPFWPEEGSGIAVTLPESDSPSLGSGGACPSRWMCEANSLVPPLLALTWAANWGELGCSPGEVGSLSRCSCHTVLPSKVAGAVRTWR